MAFDILHRYSGAVLFASATATDIASAVADAMSSGATLHEADLSRANLYGANLSRADLYRADLSGANLYGADLYEANLYRANLSRANLYGADLSGADLSGADLSGADLRGADLYEANLYRAVGVSAYASTPLMMLLDQPGKIRAYKLVNVDGYGPFNGGVYYEVGLCVEELVASTDPSEHCGAGINVATLDWCIREWKEGYRILVIEFEAKDIAAIPVASDGKFRIFRCDVVGEKNLADIGIGATVEQVEPDLCVDKRHS
jgi:hypothetical protein